LCRPASDQWNVDAAKAIQALLCVPNLGNEHRDNVMPEVLTKKIEIEEEGAKIPEHQPVTWF